MLVTGFVVQASPKAVEVMDLFGTRVDSIEYLERAQALLSDPSRYSFSLHLTTPVH
jgi:hypothetical protein